MGEGLAEANPVAGTHKATKEAPRDRVLTDAELAEAWRHAGRGDFGAIVRLLILTGQRREEVGGMLWPEVQAATWRIEAERAKNGRAHDVPLWTRLSPYSPAARRARSATSCSGRGAGAVPGMVQREGRSRRRHTGRVARTSRRKGGVAALAPT